MTLSDLRRLCIRNQMSVSFPLASGAEYQINQHGATVLNGEAGWLSSPPEFETASRFRVTGAGSARSVSVSRRWLEGLAEETFRRKSSESQSHQACNPQALLQFQG